MSGGKKGSVLWGSLLWNWRLSFLLSWTKVLLLSRFLVRPSSLVFMGWFVKHLNFSACIMFLASLRWPRGWTPVSLSISVIGVDRIAPVIRWSAWFWTLSRACWLVFAVVDHTVEPYSRWGLTVPWYTVFSIFSLASQVVPASLRRIAILRLAFASALAECCFQVCLLSNVIPRYVASSSSFSGVPPRVMVPAFCFGDRVNKVVEDLSLSTATHHFSVQLMSLSAANCNLYVAVVAYSSLHQITKSSAYNAALTPFGSGMGTSHDHLDWPRLSYREQFKEEDEEADRGNDGKTTSKNGLAFHGTSHYGKLRTERSGGSWL